jgi:hypothetical protein
LEHWDPFSVLLLVYEEAPERLREVFPEPYAPARKRLTREWHWGRVRFLVENPTEDPIIIKNGTKGLYVPDGNHRLCAAILRGDPAILAKHEPAEFFPDWLLYDLG